MIRTENPGFEPANVKPLMSKDVFHLHHGVHYAGYVRAVNEAVLGLPQESLGLAHVVEFARLHQRTKLYRNAGQAWNHGFFFAGIAGEPGSTPEGPLGEAIGAQFGSYEAFCAAFEAASKRHFASGWLWLTADRDGELSIESTQDADPIWMTGDSKPVLVCDLWEHTYYLDWRSDRLGFVREFIRRWVNWSFASVQFDAAKRGELAWRHP